MLIAPAYTADALAAIAKKVNVRVLEVPLPASARRNACEMKRVGGGMLVQSPTIANVRATELRSSTQARADTPDEVRDLMFAWRVAKFVKSNAIVYCARRRTLGVGAGQMSRVDSARIAAIKAANAGLSLERLGRRRRTRSSRSATASTSWPTTARTAVIQPGGSMRDDGSDRGRRRARHRDGVHRHAPLPALGGHAYGAQLH